MKYLIAIFALSSCASLPLPIKAKVCYSKNGVTVCAESDGKSVVIEASK